MRLRRDADPETLFSAVNSLCVGKGQGLQVLQNYRPFVLTRFVYCYSVYFSSASSY